MNETTKQANPAGTATAGLTLHRALGPVMAIAVVVGSVIGSGIFLKPGTIAADGGQFGLIISVWIFGGVLCILGGLCFAELGTMLPSAGGLYVYLREAYGRLMAFLFAWNELLFNRPAAIGALAVAFAGSLTLALESAIAPLSGSTGRMSEPMRDASVVLLAVVLIGSMAWVNIMGVLWGGRLQLITTVIKATGLALVAVTPFLLLPFAAESVRLDNYASTVTPEHADLATRVGLVLLAVMWAYNGWHSIAPLAEEVRDPQRNIPFSLFVGIGLLIVLYVGANFAYHGVLSMDELSEQGEKASEYMLKKLFGVSGLTIMSSIIMCSTFGAINSNMLQAPRVTFAMGRDGVFFRVLGHIHANFRTPAIAIFVTALMAIALVAGVAVAKHLVRDVTVGVAVADSAPRVYLIQDAKAGGELHLVPRMIRGLQDGTIFTLLTNFVIFAASIFYTLAVLAVVILRIRHPEWARPYKTWGYPVVPLLFIAAYVWFLTRIYVDKPLESCAGLLLIVAGIPAYFAYATYAKYRLSTGQTKGNKVC